MIYKAKINTQSSSLKQKCKRKVIHTLSIITCSAQSPCRSSVHDIQKNASLLCSGSISSNQNHMSIYTPSLDQRQLHTVVTPLLHFSRQIQLLSYHHSGRLALPCSSFSVFSSFLLEKAVPQLPLHQMWGCQH
jgi:hypothetical protein